MIHKDILVSLDGRTKFISWLFVTISMFFFQNYSQYIMLTVFILILLYLFYSKEERKNIFHSWKIVLFIPTLNLVANSLFINGEVLYRFLVFSLTDTDIKIFMRIFLLLVTSRIILAKTNEKELGVSIGKIFHSLTFQKVNSSVIPLIIIIMLSFVDTFKDVVQEVNKSYLIRTKGIQHSGVVKRFLERVQLLSPILMISLRKAEQLSTALIAKGYNKNSQIVNYKEIKYKKIDYFSYLFVGVVMFSILLY
ncbi:MAG: energy-coupling factor transporter transmembrane protein EcfT [Tetragenococcus sp.]|nr:energy-coupling factor transporter transmembrane protein EcfT [Tetragenococcus sp.]